MLARFFLIAAAACFMLAPAALATELDQDGGEVIISITPTVDVTFVSGGTDSSDYQADEEICATVRFLVHANAQQIRMRGGSTHFFKEHIVGSLNHVPVDSTKDALIDALGAPPPMAGLPVFDGYRVVDGTFATAKVYRTMWLDFGSDDGVFSFDVDFTICWHGEEIEILQGDYYAYVILWSTFPTI